MNIEFYLELDKMQVGWQGLGRVASPREGSEPLNYVWNLYRSLGNAGGLAGSR